MSWWYSKFDANGGTMNVTYQLLGSKENVPMELLLTADPSEKLVNSYLEKGICYTAVLDGETIGVALVMETKPSTVEIMNIAIKEAYQNKGIGKHLLQFVIGEIKKGETKTIEIGTGNPGVVQMLVYQKCGFRIVGIDFDFFRRNYDEAIYENGIECRDMIRMKIDV